MEIVTIGSRQGKEQQQPDQKFQRKRVKSRVYRQWVAKNRERRRTSQKEWYQEHQNRERAKHQAYYTTHQEQERARARAYYQQHHASIRVRQRHYYQRKKQTKLSALRDGL